MRGGPPPPPPSYGGEGWSDVPIEEIDLPSFLGRSPTSSEDRLAAVMEGARAISEERERRRAEEIAAHERARRRAHRRRRARNVVVGTAVVAVVLAAGVALRENPSVRASLDELAAGSTSDDVTTTSVATGSDGPATTAIRPPTTVPAPSTTTTPTVPRRPPPGNRPSPQPATSATPLGTPAPVLGDGPHAFVATGADGRPAAYDPCRPIPFVVNNRMAPPDGDAVVDSALAEITRVTGLQFVREGPSDEVAVVDRLSYQPDLFGNRWAPVLISWSDPAVNPELEGTILGQGGSAWLETGGHAVFITGSVVLDGPELAQFASEWNGAAEVRAVVIHELAHLVGLDHVDDPAQLMYPDTTGVTELAAGDLAGLAELGRGACIDLL